MKKSKGKAPNELPTPKHPKPQRSAPGLKFQPPNGMPLNDENPNGQSDFNPSNYMDQDNG
jgi:hypothetical protein